MRKLSKRERLLIDTAFLLLVFYVGNVVLGIPVTTRYEETGQRLAGIQLEKKNLEAKLDSGDTLCREYQRKKEAVKRDMEQYGKISTGTGLEQYLLACFESVGLRPMETRVTTLKSSGEESCLSGGIEARTVGSYDASVRVLDEIGQNPALYVERYVLYPEEGTTPGTWNMTARITCRLPASWEEASELAPEDLED